MDASILFQAARQFSDEDKSHPLPGELSTREEFWVHVISECQCSLEHLQGVKEEDIFHSENLSGMSSGVCAWHYWPHVMKLSEKFT